MNEEENKSVEAVENAVEQGKEAARAEKENLDDGVIRVDLRNFKQEQEDAVQEQETDASNAIVGESTNKESSEAVVEEVREPSKTEESIQASEEPVLEEITEEEVQEQTEKLVDELNDAIDAQEQSGIELPENIQKVVDFINDTGGTLEDYVRLNQDYSQLNEAQVLREYYETTKPHLDKEDIDLLMEDFSYDEDLDDEREIRKAKLAFKEEVAKAKNHLEDQKSKYYEEIKAGSRLTPEQQKAVEFFNRYNKENEEVTRVAEKQKKTFLKRTDEVFSNEFKGFEYSVGDKKYRFNVKDASQVKNVQSDINNFVKKFLDENNNIKDAKGYHKSLFTAMNADAIANHFYEQGKADALKESIARSKNVNMDPRKSHEPVTDAKGFKVRAISGDDTSRLKVKIRK
jgi:hypothetical protein